MDLHASVTKTAAGFNVSNIAFMRSAGISASITV